jgi:hypothetical protein
MELAIALTALVGFAVLGAIAFQGRRRTRFFRDRGRHIPLAPWWLVGGQPDADDIAMPRDRRMGRRSRR